jgi:drug/metabolite transporter (DMT)-like permease
MKPQQRRLLGFVEIIAASICFGFLGIFGKLAFTNNFSVGELLSYRFMLAAFLLWIILILFKPDWTKISGKQFLISAGLGIFGYALFATLYFKAVEGLSVALASLLLYTYPLWVQLIAFLFGERPSAWQLLCTAIAFIGLVFLLWGQITVTSFLAFLCGLGSAIAYAIYIVVSGKFQSQIRPITSSLYVMTACAFALIFFHNPSVEKLENFSTTQALIIFGIAIVCTIVPMTLVLGSLQKLKKTEVSLLSMIEPLTAAIASWLVLKEALSILQIIGVILVLGGLALRFREPGKSIKDLD